ncbi:MAG: GNAT family N-acetyltransferase [Chloroflexi bacterium]|nr:GNAT family N-acetyltransferase [Chloroflexota bacterium]
MQRRPDAREVWAAARRHLAMVAVNLPDPHVVLRGPALLLITGAPAPDFNMALLEAAPMAETILREFVALVRAADVPALFMLSSTTDTSLRAVAHEAGLSEAGSAPLMVLTDLPAVTAGRTDAFAVETVADPTRLAHVADLVAAGFGLDRDWVGRVFAAPSLLNAPGVTYFLASHAGEPYSTVTTTGTQGMVGIWSMATAPEHQRRGAGRAVLQAALDHHLAHGADAFYLVATPAGKPLYDAVGFETVDDLAIWVTSHSAQFAHV